MSLETKQICAKALLNLVAEDTLPALIEVISRNKLYTSYSCTLYPCWPSDPVECRELAVFRQRNAGGVVKCRQRWSVRDQMTSQNTSMHTMPLLSHGQEGIVSAATNLSKLDDEDSMRACATVFALLSADPRGRAKFVQRKSALVSLFGLLRSTDQGTQVICGKVNDVVYDVATFFGKETAGARFQNHELLHLLNEQGRA